MLDRHDAKKCHEFRPLLYFAQQPTTRREETHALDWRQSSHLQVYDLSFRKGYKQHFALEVFEIVGISSEKTLTYTVKDEQDEIIPGNIQQKELIKVF